MAVAAVAEVPDYLRVAPSVFESTGPVLFRVNAKIRSELCSNFLRKR